MRPLPARVAAVFLVLLLALPVSGSVALASTDEEPPPTVESPATTVNDFIPEDQNLSDCLGALERPGCGSESRGGWRQTVTFSVMALGLVVVFGRIFWSVRRNQRS